MEKQSFSLKLLSGDFYGQSFIKTVRGPLSFSGFPVYFEILIASCSSKIDLGRPGMTFSQYSAEENNKTVGQ